MTAMYRPAPMPGVKLWHEEWQHDERVNSVQGDIDAAHHDKDWIDNDFGLSFDLHWCNGHQNPSWIWFRKGESFRGFTWKTLSARTYKGRHLRDARQAFVDAKAHGLKVEFEVKFVGPITDAQLRQAFVELRQIAQDVWGETWAEHVRIKCLTSLRGGTKYALRVLRAAHAAGFQTILLARGAATLRPFRGYMAITWVRGSRVIRPKKRK